MRALIFALMLAFPARPGLLADEPPAPPARADLSEASALLRDAAYAEADEKLAALQASHPDDSALLLMRGEVLLTLNRAQEARPLLERSLELDATSQRGWFQLANARGANGDDPGALAAFGRATETGTDSQIRIFAHVNRSLLLQKSRDWTGAAQELEKVIELDPSRGEAFGDLASLYLEAGNLTEAQKALERGSGAGFASAQLFYVVGARQHEKKANEAAARAFERAIQIDPQMGQAEKGLALVLRELGRPQEADSHLRRYLELVPNAPDAATIKAHLRAAEKH
jgi:tetratricopeptide (TPR) repeat protein